MLFLRIAPGAVWSGVLTLAGAVVGVTSRFDRSMGRQRIRFLAPVRALADRGGSARLIVTCARSRGRFRYSQGPAPWPSLVAPTAGPSPVLGAGCRPGVVDGMDVVSSTVPKMRLAVSRMGSGSVPVAAAAMPVVDRPNMATATSRPTRRRRPGLPLPWGWPDGPGHGSQLGQRRLLAGQLGRPWCCDHRRQQRGHLGVPRGVWSGGRSPSRSRSARSSSTASGSGSGVNGSRLISADQRRRQPWVTPPSGRADHPGRRPAARPAAGAHGGSGPGPCSAACP